MSEPNVRSHPEPASRLSQLGTAVLCDAVLRLGLPLRLAPPGLRRVAGDAVAGRCLGVRHRGSVDVFLAAIARARTGDLLVIDNDGRRDEGCIGDLTALEAQAAGVAAILVWGGHRDSAALREIGLAVFSYGAFAAGPRRLDAEDGQPPRFGGVVVSGDDWCCADDDGAVFLAAASVEAVTAAAERIHERERLQAAAVRAGTPLREQFRFADYEQRKRRDAAYTLRAHLERLGAAIEV